MENADLSGTKETIKKNNKYKINKNIIKFVKNYSYLFKFKV